ncbi:MAG: MaoC family dehydratase [Pseudomonadota bacterium]|nr:MaoC family dehydratase [Pseudomonadota bacterium]
MYFEDVHVGLVRTTGTYEMTREEILAFASEFDPQPFHLDEEAAKRSVFGGLCASGWHTASVMMHLQVTSWISREGSMGSPGFDDLRWLRPVRPGDVLSVRNTCIEVTPSRSRPDKGSARFRAEVLNQNGEVVLDATLIGMYRRREPAKANGEN